MPPDMYLVIYIKRLYKIFSAISCRRLRSLDPLIPCEMASHQLVCKLCDVRCFSSFMDSIYGLNIREHYLIILQMKGNENLVIF